MAYSTQNNTYDIITNYVKKVFPLSLKTYPSCTNSMAWAIQDEARSAYILSLVHQTDMESKIIIIDSRGQTDNIGIQRKIPKVEPFVKKFEIHPKRRSHSDISSQKSYSIPSIQEQNIGIKSRSSSVSEICIKQESFTCGIQDEMEPGVSSVSNSSVNISRDIKIEPSEETSLSRDSIEDENYKPKNIKNEVVSNVDSFLRNQSGDHFATQQVRKKDSQLSVRKEYKLLAAKFHQYTVKCNATMKTLQRKIEKLISHKHLLIQNIAEMRDGQKEIIRKYRKIFDAAMIEHFEAVNVLVDKYNTVRDNYLQAINNQRGHEVVQSFSYSKITYFRD